MKLSVEWVPGLAIGVGCLASLVMFPDLPGAFSWPYSFAQPLIAFALPATAAVTYLILRRLWGETANERAHEADPEAAHRAIAVRLVFFVVAIHLLILLNLGGAQWVRGWGSRLVVVLFGGVIIATGNLLPRTRPNLAFGIRTALTLSDRRLWMWGSCRDFWRGSGGTARRRDLRARVFFLGRGTPCVPACRAQ